MCIKKTLLIGIFIFIFIFPQTPIPKQKSTRLPITAYQHKLNRRFIKQYRKQTKYIIIHTSEAGKRSTLRTLSKGKRIRKYWTKGGHANYMIDRMGKTYRILHHRFRADHAGLSMWNGRTNLSSYSIGIELVGFHYGEISDKQYQSIRKLLRILKRIYRLKDKDILTHAQVSYGRPNRWFRRNHRGRKKCALNFSRIKAGLRDGWRYDPDVRHRRLMDDLKIKQAFYVANARNVRRKTMPVFSRKTMKQRKLTNVNLSNIIGKNNTAWSIAGEDYNDDRTLYVLPSGRKLRGNRIGKQIGWNKIPRGTAVLLNHPLGEEKNSGPIYTISGEYTAWSYAGKQYNHTNTIYFLPSGQVKPGNRIHDWDSLPQGTRLIIGFNGPFVLNISSVKDTLQFIRDRFENRTVVLHLTQNQVVTIQQLYKLNKLPTETKIYFRNH